MTVQERVPKTASLSRRACSSAPSTIDRGSSRGSEAQGQTARVSDPPSTIDRQSSATMPPNLVSVLPRTTPASASPTAPCPCRTRSGTPFRCLTLPLLSQLRRETPTAEEATKNPRPGGQTRVGISAGTMHNPARLCWEALWHRIPLGGSPNRNLQGRPGRLKEEINLPARANLA